jgi:uncharacterized protein (TIGR03437 family)
MATIVSANAMAVFLTEPGASGYRLAGLEMTIQNSVNLSYGIVVLGDGSATSAAQLPSDIIVDRSYIHGTSTCNCQRGVAFNGIGEAVIDSYISDIHWDGVDSQAICGWAGPGPFKIVNNYLEAAGENIMFGGSPPAITNLIPSDIEIRQNHIIKPLTWMSPNPKLWTVKNLFELKNAQRMIMDGNILENNWIEAQSGFAILFQGIPQSNTDLWSTVQDITFTNNILRHSNSGVNFCGGCWYATAPDPGNSRVARVYFANNLLDDINGPAYDGGTGAGGGLAFQLLSNVSDLVIAHNTVLNTGTLMVLDGKPSPRVNFVNNIASHGPWGITGSGLGSGNTAITTLLPDSVIAGNLIVGLQNTLTAQNYPTGNLFPTSMTAVGFVTYANGNGGNYQLSSSSIYRNAGMDGKDPGVDTTGLDNALSGIDATPSIAIAITSPTSAGSFTTPASTINLGGNASDPVGVTEVTWVTDRGISGTAAGTTNWIVHGLALPTGITRITVTATNALGDQSSAKIAISVDPGIDSSLIFVSSASLESGPVAPESMVTALGSYLADATQATASPIPTKLANCSVIIQDADGAQRAAGLYYVSPSQINFAIPAGTALGLATVTVYGGDQIRATGTLSVAVLSPALFFLNQDGLAAATLMRATGDSSAYEATSRLDAETGQFVAIPIDLGTNTDQVYLTLYGTGFRYRPSPDSVHMSIAGMPVPVVYAGASLVSEDLDIVTVLLPQQLRGQGSVGVFLNVGGAGANVVRVSIQ